MYKNIIIRRGKLENIDILVELLIDLFTIETDFIIDIQRQKKGLSLMLEENLQGCIIMVAECDKKVVGMCSGQLLISTAEGGLKVMVEDLVVASDERNYGVGSALLSEIEEWAISCGASRIDLLADRRNHFALNFYNRHNWEYTEMIALQKSLQ